MKAVNTATAHHWQNDSFELPKLSLLPHHPHLADLLQRQDWFDASSLINEDADVHHSSTKEEIIIIDIGIDDKVDGQKRNRVSFMNKCLRAQKSFFLRDNHPDDLYNKILDDFFLDGIIISVPRQGKSNSYKIISDTSTVGIPIAKEELRSLIWKEEDDIIRQLELTRSKFDTNYPNEPPLSILSVKHRSRNSKKQLNPSKKKKKKNSSKKKQSKKQSKKR